MFKMWCKPVFSHIFLPSLTTFKKLAFGLNGRGGKGRSKNIALGLQSRCSVDEQLMMCGDCIWLSRPLQGKVKNCSFLEAVGMLKGLFNH